MSSNSKRKRRKIDEPRQTVKTSEFTIPLEMQPSAGTQSRGAEAEEINLQSLSDRLEQDARRYTQRFPD